MKHKEIEWLEDTGVAFLQGVIDDECFFSINPNNQDGYTLTSYMYGRRKEKYDTIDGSKERADEQMKGYISYLHNRIEDLTQNER